MKPTQQEIIELAREASMTVLPDETLWWAVHQDELERFATLLLERFGAGGGEPVLFSHPDIFAMKAAHVGVSKPGHELPGYIPLYTHPSPTDLRDEYLRGLDDAAKVCEYVATLYSEAARKHPEDSESRSRTFARSRAASQCVEEIRALLKDKQ